MADLLLSAQDLTKAFGAEPLFEGLSFGIFEGDRVGVVGPNGSGKSTLLRILAGDIETDSGTVARRRGLRVAYVAQDPEFAKGATVESTLGDAVAALRLDETAAATRIAIARSRAGLDDPAREVAALSGGWKKRLAIARALALEPELLLMDEPTNHLDVEGILWLESLLATEPRASVVVSHDRYFLENVALRMLEVNRSLPAGLLDVKGRYSEFLGRKDTLLAEQAAYQESLANRVRREIEWLRRGAKARTRKAMARVNEAGRLIDELADVQERSATATAGIALASSGRRTRELLKAKGVSKAWAERDVVRGLNLVLTPGTRLGLLGPNGSGKTTLLRLLSGELPPDAGEVVRAEHLRIVEFEQDRTSLDLGVSLRRTLAPEGDAVVHQGRSIHVAGWAKRFLFRGEQLDQPVGRLSGGEKARVMLARVMLQPADLLLLDEPTNDLDIPTLEALEETLLEYAGALVLVTHDRYLLDRVSTHLLALDGRGGATYYADLPQWEAARAEALAEPARKARTAAAKPEAPTPRRKLGWKESQEWDQMETRILEAEDALSAANAAAHDPGIATDAAELQARVIRLAEAQAEVERLYDRWAELEAKVR